MALLVLAGCGESPGAGPVDAAPTPDSAIAGLPEGEWAWLDVAGTRCMDGSATGLGVNPGAGDELLLFFQGGGACFNPDTCANVANAGGFGADELAEVAQAFGGIGVFDRGDPDNPFRDWTYVFVPYCTGDVFAGTNPDGYEGRVQVGYDNVGASLEFLLPDFAGVERVVLTGVSAGGLGAAYNYDRVQTAFSDVPVLLLDDSGPLLADDVLTPCLQTQLRDLWNLDATLPADCTECRRPDGGGLVNLLPFAAAKHPERRFGLITSDADGTIRLFYSFGYPDCDSPRLMEQAVFEAGVASLRDEVLAPYANARVFTLDSDQHVWLLSSPLAGVTSGGVSLTDWIGAFLAGDPGWADVVP